MKTELRLRPHTLLADTAVIDVYYDGDFIATVTGTDGPGVRVHSRYVLTATPDVSIPDVHVRVSGRVPNTMTIGVSHED